MSLSPGVFKGILYLSSYMFWCLIDHIVRCESESVCANSCSNDETVYVGMHSLQPQQMYGTSRWTTLQIWCQGMDQLVSSPI